MRQAQFVLKTTDVQPFAELTKEYLNPDYSNVTEQVHIYSRESFRLINKAMQWEMVVFKIEKDHIVVDIIAGAGATGIINSDWGTEWRFVKKFANVIVDYCNENNISGTKEFWG